MLRCRRKGDGGGYGCKMRLVFSTASSVPWQGMESLPLCHAGHSDKL